MLNERKCCRCKRFKSFEDFYFSKGRYRYECKKCTIRNVCRKQREKRKAFQTENRSYMVEYYAANKEKFAEYRRRFKERHPNYFREYKEKSLNKKG